MAKPIRVTRFAYTLTLANSSGAGATGLAIANPLDAHTRWLGGHSTARRWLSINQFHLMKMRRRRLLITLQGQDPDGSSVIFKQATPRTPSLPISPRTRPQIATAHGTIGISVRSLVTRTEFAHSRLLTRGRGLFRLGQLYVCGQRQHSELEREWSRLDHRSTRSTTRQPLRIPEIRRSK